MSELFSVSIDEEILCVKREIALREFVYPRFVADGRMKPDRAEREIETMRSILNRLTTLRNEARE